MNELQNSAVYRLLKKPMRLDELRRALPGLSKQALNDELAALGAAGLILRNKKNRYAWAEHYGCAPATFLATERAFAFARVDGLDEDVFLPPGRDGGAWNGDRVLVRIYDEGRDGRREGEVLHILSRAGSEITGVVHTRGRSFFLEAPKYPRIALPAAHLHGAQPGDRVSVRVMFYGDRRLPPQGAVVAVHGREGSMEASIAAILRENGIVEGFSPEAEAQALACGDRVEPAALDGRLDLRETITFTIDGDDAKDFDDAVSLETTAEGRLRLGVHIADVSHYVTPGSPLDRDALSRGTSVYYPGHVIPMLPFALSHGICSLNPGVDRLTFSVFMDYDPAGHQLTGGFAQRSVIRSAARLTYAGVNRLLAGDETERTQHARLVPTLEGMAALAAELHRQRVARGALELDIPEAAIAVDESGQPVAVSFRPRGTAERMIEEFMLAANEYVAHHMVRAGAPTVYRIHEKPDPEKLRAFAAFARPFGYRLDASRPEDTHQLQAVLDGAKDDPRQRALPTLLLRSLARARYDERCTGHYGLAAKEYLHFTSPIRRYPDLAAHRMLQKQLEGSSFGREDFAFCEEAAAQSTAREQAADTAERDIDKLYLAAYMQQFLGEDFDGEVSGVTGFGLFVALPNAVEGLVRIEALPDDFYEYDDTRMTLTGRRSGRRYTIGTPLRVTLAAADPASGQIDFVPAAEQP